jgi:hypothetical protein
MKRKILIITLSNLKHDARVRRQVEWLKENYDITLAGFEGSPPEGFSLINLNQTRLTFWRKAAASVFLLLRQFETAFYILHQYNDQLTSALGAQNFDLIIGNDIESLPIAFSVRENTPVLFDAHEYAPRHFEDKIMWRIFFKPLNEYLCRKYLPRVAILTTVGKRLAEEYQKNYHVKTAVIPNATGYFDLQPTPVETNKIKLVHVGIANPSRQLELMIDLMFLLDDRFSLDMYLLTPGFASKKTRNYIQLLTNMIGNDTRIRILPPIPSKEVVPTINKYDVGVFLLPPINFNYENTLPNKLFDFIQARLAIAIGPTPEMAEIVRKFNNGVIADDFFPASLATKLNKLSIADVQKLKNNSNEPASIYHAENNKVILEKLVKSAMARP